MKWMPAEEAPEGWVFTTKVDYGTGTGISRVLPLIKRNGVWFSPEGKPAVVSPTHYDAPRAKRTISTSRNASPPNTTLQPPR